MIAKLTFEKLTKKGLTIAFAESITGGALTHELIKNAGASQVLKGSIVAYSIDLKTTLLKIKPEIINDNGVVSEKVAIEMAKSIKHITASDLAVAITGNAGPSFQGQSQQQEAYLSIIYGENIFNYRLDLSRLSRLEAIDKAVFETYWNLENII